MQQYSWSTVCINRRTRTADNISRESFGPYTPPQFSSYPIGVCCFKNVQYKILKLLVDLKFFCADGEDDKNRDDEKADAEVITTRRRTSF